MYSENQAIQKKRDNVQTSALEWIIAHLKVLQNNIVNNTLVREFSLQVTLDRWALGGPDTYKLSSTSPPII